MEHLPAVLRRLLRRARSERGFTLVELIAVMAILSIVMTGVVSLYISGVRTQARLTAAFQAQTALHVGLDKMRTDVHLACSQTAQTATSVTFSGQPCDGTNLITWCTRGSGSVYGLYRIVGSTCTGGDKFGDYLTSGSIFTYFGPNVTAGSNALPRLHLDMTVNSTPTIGSTRYRVIDDLVFRNGVRV